MVKKYSKYIFILLLSTTLISCNNIITVLDEYNSPYVLEAIAGNGTIFVQFVSGVTASDFDGFNIYINDTGEDFILYSDAMLNSSGGLPTIEYDAHSRQQITLQVPGTYVNGTTYYVSVTAYGTNPLADDGRIETAISTVVEVVPGS